MTTRELLLVILNQTNEELSLEPGSLSLGRGEMMDTPDSKPPQEILAGESGMLRCKSSHIGRGVEGSITYQIVGYEGENRVKFVWDVPYLGANHFAGSSLADGFMVKILGGQGSQAVVVFVFTPITASEVGLWRACSHGSLPQQ
ncbi:hypothetical protein ACJZ2D_011448 [Fusarium nematophilum]